MAASSPVLPKQALLGHLEHGSRDGQVGRSQVSVQVYIELFGQILDAELRVGYLLAVELDPGHLSFGRELEAQRVLPKKIPTPET